MIFFFLNGRCLQSVLQTFNPSAEILLFNIILCNILVNVFSSHSTGASQHLKNARRICASIAHIPFYKEHHLYFGSAPGHSGDVAHDILGCHRLPRSAFPAERDRGKRQCDFYMHGRQNCDVNQSSLATVSMRLLRHWYACLVGWRSGYVIASPFCFFND